MSKPSDQETMGAQIYMIARLTLNEIHRIEEGIDDLFSADDKFNRCLPWLKKFDCFSYTIRLLEKGSYNNARGVLRELIRDFAPRS